MDTLSLVTTRRFEDVETCVRQRQIDLIIAGHHNRLLGVLSSHSLEYINHLAVDVLIKRLTTQGGLQQGKTVFNKRGQRLRAAHQGHCAGERRLLQVGDPERLVPPDGWCTAPAESPPLARAHQSRRVSI